MQFPLSSPVFHANVSIPHVSAEHGLLPVTAIISAHLGALLSLLLLPLLGYITYKDYCVFLSLGPGGVPYNFYGYMKITSLRVVALRNTKTPGPIPPHLIGTGYLRAELISFRSAPRPHVIGIVPHRQINMRSSKEIFDLLSLQIRNLAKAYPSRLRIARSCFEKHCPALFSKMECNKTCNGEVCHAHPSDGSMHMTLHPEDAEKVIRAGWGERHPLARGGWCSRFVPEGFIMVYAPRDASEIDTVLEIIKAGMGWVSGCRLAEMPEVDITSLPEGEKEVASNEEAMEMLEQGEAKGGEKA